jgi:uncharacterized membrane protein
MSIRNKKYIPYILTLSGLVGLFASFTLTVEKIELLKNPAKELGCDLNPVIACGSVINTSQAEAFGFANPLIGIAGFAGLLAIGLALFAGAKLDRWFWQTIQVGLLMAVLFVHWLFFQTVYRIEALCPYCMVAWVVTITAFWYSLIYSLQNQVIAVPKKLESVSDFVQKHHFDILIVWFLVLIGLILNHFWYYWKTLV